MHAWRHGALDTLRVVLGLRPLGLARAQLIGNIRERMNHLLENNLRK